MARVDCPRCKGTGEVIFTKEYGGPQCQNCGGNGYLTDEILARYLGGILDHPSLYMGGASKGSLRKAEKIISFLKEQNIIT